MPTPRPAGSRTRADVVTPSDLTPAQRDRMYALMSGHFMNVKPEQFESDLSEKDSVVMIYDQSGQVQGFTTIAVLEGEDQGQSIVGVYSGDTVLAPEFWGENSWLSVWAKHAFGISEQNSDRPTYWVLLTATHRTYRFLPGFFKTFHPNPEEPETEESKRRLELFVRMKFPEEYDANRGVVSLKDRTPLRFPEQAEAGVPMHDRYARYFVERNPGYLQSDFLACLTPLVRSNLTRLGARVAGSR